MKNIIKIFMAIALIFGGLGAFANYFNPNLDVHEVRASHILVKTRPEAVKIKKEIESGQISFEDAAREYSLCPSGQNGGDLGYFNRKQMVQQFSDTAFDLKVGQISDPVGTKFGWHIIKTTAKRLIQGGGVKIDGEKITDMAYTISFDDSVVLQAGKRKFAKLVK